MIQINEFLSSLKEVVPDMKNKSEEFIKLIIQTYDMDNSTNFLLDNFEKALLDSNEIFLNNVQYLLNYASKTNIPDKYKNYVNYNLTIIYNAFKSENDDEYFEFLIELTEKRYVEQNKLTNDLQKNIKQQQKNINEILPNTISVMGIFVAIIVIMFGGFSLIDIFAGFENLSAYRVITVALITGQIIFNVLFLLMYLLARLSNKHICSSCSNFKGKDKDKNYQMIDKHCDNCVLFEKKETKCSLFKRTFYRYPYMYIFNIGIILMELFLVSFWLIDKCFKEYNLTVENPIGVSIGIIMVVLLIIVSAFYFLMTWDSPKQNEENKHHRIRDILIIVSITLLSCGILLYCYNSFITVAPKYSNEMQTTKIIQSNII